MTAQSKAFDCNVECGQQVSHIDPGPKCNKHKQGKAQALTLLEGVKNINPHNIFTCTIQLNSKFSTERSSTAFCI